MLANSHGDSYRRSNNITHAELLLPEGAEIVGVLKSVEHDTLVLEYSGHDVRISITPDIGDKAKKLIGEKVAVLRLTHRFYLRRIKNEISVLETPSSKNGETKNLKHFHIRKCCNLRRCFTGMSGVSFCGYNEGGVLNG